MLTLIKKPMDKERYWLIESNQEDITEEEFEQGWHFCVEWDFMLVGPGMRELECCMCLSARKAKEELDVS